MKKGLISVFGPMLAAGLERKNEDMNERTAADQDAAWIPVV